MSKFREVTLYACGGAGINVAKTFEKYRREGNSPEHNDEAFARINPVYIDTSRTNLSDGVADDKHIYIVKSTDPITGQVELDGSGKKRSINADVISQHTLDMLQTYVPTNVSIVISSASGGSGSVIAPSIVSELLDRDKIVIVLLMGSEDSVIEIENTSKTIKTYENIAKLRKKPVVVFYANNSDFDKGRTQVNQEMVETITRLSALFSGNNRELDSKDLENWVNFNKTTSFTPKIAFLDCYYGKIEQLKSGQVISIATLCLEGENSSPGIIAEYQAVGYVTKEQNTQLNISPNIHYVILDGIFNDVHVELAQKLRSFDEEKRARVVKQTILTEQDKPTSNGLIL